MSDSNLAVKPVPTTSTVLLTQSSGDNVTYHPAYVVLLGTVIPSKTIFKAVRKAKAFLLSTVIPLTLPTQGL